MVTINWLAIYRDSQQQVHRAANLAQSDHQLLQQYVIGG
jgi:hypothetical protein